MHCVATSPRIFKRDRQPYNLSQAWATNSKFEAVRLLRQATNCRITGSDLVQRLKLDERFCVLFTTHLTWAAAVASQAAAASSNGHEAGGGWMQSFTSQLSRPFSRGASASDAALLGHVKVDKKQQQPSVQLASP